jgi:hypothetical protein
MREARCRESERRELSWFFLSLFFPFLSMVLVFWTCQQRHTTGGGAIRGSIRGRGFGWGKSEGMHDVTHSFKGKTECIDHACARIKLHTLRHNEYKKQCHTNKELLQTIVLNES